ncbi:hypothetical protein MSKU3_3326 [Komagataeibacter oboediens]|nr:hypothetical protein MSKU3_3326 [Komagataeibacter oboediens]
MTEKARISVAPAPLTDTTSMPMRPATALAIASTLVLFIWNVLNSAAHSTRSMDFEAICTSII